MHDNDRIIEEILTTFRQRGGQRYGTEEVTQLEHALQAAQLAQQSGATSAHIAAALLHDIGHLLKEPQLSAGEHSKNLDDQHEIRGERWLRRHFVDDVCAAVRMHVSAKRYLSTIDPSYPDQLSPTSYQSFLDQGGLMSDDERDAFAADPHCEAAITLRRWDDQAKIVNLSTPGIETFVEHLRASLKTGADPL